MWRQLHPILIPILSGPTRPHLLLSTLRWPTQETHKGTEVQNCSMRRKLLLFFPVCESLKARENKLAKGCSRLACEAEHMANAHVQISFARPSYACRGTSPLRQGVRTSPERTPAIMPVSTHASSSTSFFVALPALENPRAQMPKENHQELFEHKGAWWPSVCLNAFGTFTS